MNPFSGLFGKSGPAQPQTTQGSNPFAGVLKNAPQSPVAQSTPASKPSLASSLNRILLHNPVEHAVGNVAKSTAVDVGNSAKTFGKAVTSTPAAIGRELQNKPVTDIQKNVFGTTNSSKIAGKVGGSVLTLASLLGGGVVKGGETAAQTGLKAALGRAAKSGVKLAPSGAAYGAGQGLSSGQSGKQVLKDAALGGASTVALGAGGSLAKSLIKVRSGGASVPNEVIPTGKTSKTPLNPTVPKVQIPDTLPKEGKFKNLVSVSGELSRQGASGKEIATRLSKAESASETGQAAFLKKIPTVAGLKKNEFPQFVKTLGTLEKASPRQEQTILDGLSPKIKQAVDEWSSNIPSIRERASTAGVKVGDLGKYYFPRNYSELLSKQDSLSQAATHLVKTGQAKDLGDAVRQLNMMKSKYTSPFGHFEQSRTLDLPNYDMSKNALVNYVGGAFNKIGHAEQFGAKGEVANRLIGNIAAEGRNSERALRNYQVATGTFKYNRPGIETASQKIRSFQRVTKLGLSSILNATQSTNTGALTGVGRTAVAALKNLSKEDRAYVDKTGTIIDSVINDLREQAGLTGAAKSKIGKLVNAPGFGAVEKFNRRTAAIAGRDWANRLASKGDAKSLSVLKDKLGVEGNIGKKLTEDQQIQASRKVVELTQFKTGAKDLPGWANSPEGKLIAQFRTFSYKQTGFVYNELVKEALKGNAMPLLRFVSVGVPLGFAAGNIRGTLRGQPWQSIKGNQDKPGDSGLFTKNGLYQALNNVGASGLASNAVFLAQNSKSTKLDQYITSSVGGPTAGQALTTVQNAAAARRGSPKELGREALSTVPVVGPTLKNKILPYAPSNTGSLNRAVAGNQYVKDTLKQVGINPGAPSQTQRGKQLDGKQYQKFMDDSNKAFVEKVLKARQDPGFQGLSKDDQKRTLEKALTDARTKTADSLLGKAPKVTKSKLRKY